jgi:hypothetical protein
MNVWIKRFISLFMWNNNTTNRGGKIVIEPESELINSYRYYYIMKIVKNAISIDDEELTFVKTLSKEQLIEIIEINNTNIDLFNKLIHFTEEKNKIKN